MTLEAKLPITLHANTHQRQGADLHEIYPYHTRISPHDSFLPHLSTTYLAPYLAPTTHIIKPSKALPTTTTTPPCLLAAAKQRTTVPLT
jgi:hypothetical protein